MVHRPLLFLLIVMAAASLLTITARGDVTEGLVGYWAFDETTGTVAHDFSGQNANATLDGAGLLWMPDAGLVGGALSFDGTANTEYVEIPTSYMSVQESTIAFWAKVGPDPQNPSTRYIFGHTTIPAYYNRIQLYMDNGDTELDVGLGSSHIRHLAVTTLQPEIWYHIVLTWDGSWYFVYVDGQQLATGSYTGLSELNDVANIGNNGYTTPSEIFNGLIDEFRIYDRMLTPAEVQSLAAHPKARDPIPTDGAILEDTWIRLEWSPGYYASSHDVYLGASLTDVEAGTASTFRGNQKTTEMFAGFDGKPYLEGLAAGTTYYWRVDEVNETEPDSPWKGKIWSFSTPQATAYEPTPIDKSRFVDTNVELNWTPGLRAMLHFVYFGDDLDDVTNATEGILSVAAEYIPGPLEFNKSYYWRVDEYDGVDTHKGRVWTFTVTPDGGGLRAYYFNGMSFGVQVFDRIDPQINFDWGSASPDTRITADRFSVRWIGELETAFSEKYTFYARTDDGVRLWIDGNLVVDHWADQAYTERKGSIDLATGGHSILMEYYENEGSAVADLRWESPSTPKQLIPAGAFSLLLKAGSPKPRTGAHGVTQAPVFRWSPGEQATSHEIYLGVDADAVGNATTASPEYQGSRLAGVEKFVPDELAWETTYYWRIDEVNDAPPDRLWKGNVWSFTTADFLIIDEMEDYNNYEYGRVFETWIDGYDDPCNGSIVGYPAPDFSANESFVETDVIHSGNQSMPFFYDNDLKYSEATIALTGIKRNWTQQGLKSFSLWHIGHPPSDGSFIEGPAGTYTMTGSGGDIWSVEGEEADEFHYAWKLLNGAGSITAKVGAIENMVEGKSLNEWAKAGIMIRQSLDPNSTHAFMATTPGQGIAFQYRPTPAGVSVNQAQLSTVSQRPHWIKLERNLSGRFITHHANDINGLPDEWTKLSETNIQMTSPAYIGLALSSHQRYTKARAVFSNVTITGNVTGVDFTNQDIGIISNAAETMYVSVQDSLGHSTTVYNPDSQAVQLTEWTEWSIPFSDLGGIDLSDVDKLSLGFGAKDIAQSEGAGLIFFDDIRLYRPRCLADNPKSSVDFNSDCIVDILDIAVLADQWLHTGPGLQADLDSSRMVDFEDYASVAAQWLDERFWP